MLIKCPECELQVSDKALSCPHCGFPMKSNEKRRHNQQKSHKRLPNGFGQITEITSKPLRKPFRVMVTVGRNVNGRPKCKLLKPDCYFKTYNEAYAALVEYNKNPYDLDTDLSVQELYDLWTNEYFEKIKNTSQRTITAAWAYCDEIKNMRAKDVRSRHIKGIMDKEGISPSIRERIKSLFNLMFDYGVEHEVLTKNYSRDFKIEERVVNKSHIIYTDEELDILWKHTDIDIVNIILIQCYSGWRPSEMFNLTFDWDRNIMIGGSKTKSGMNRIVPIHDKIAELAKKEQDLLNSLTYDAYFKKYKNLISTLNLNPDHSPHDGRKTFITNAKKCKMDEFAIKRIVGHAIPDITESIYTERDENWLSEEMKKLI